jgi:hypothetical protein
MRRFNIHLGGGLTFFSFGIWGSGEGFFSYVPNVFQKGSSSSSSTHHNIPNSTSNLSHIVWPQFNLHEECKGLWNTNISMVLCLEGHHSYSFMLGSAQCSRKIGVGLVNVAPSDKEKHIPTTLGAPPI